MVAQQVVALLVRVRLPMTAPTQGDNYTRTC